MLLTACTVHAQAYTLQYLHPYLHPGSGQEEGYYPADLDGRRSKSPSARTCQLIFLLSTSVHRHQEQK
jgi:hypothetical protein